jgi:hypothetical protein
MHSELRLRFDYGRLAPWVRNEDGLLAAVAGPHAVWLRSPPPLQGDGAASAEFVVSGGDRTEFVLTHAPSWHPRPEFLAGVEEVAQSEAFWAQWGAQFHYEGGWQEAPTARWTCATTWACSPRSTTRRPGGTWGTPRRRSATSGSSTPPGTCRQRRPAEPTWT